MPVIPGSGRLRQGDLESKPSLGNLARSCLKMKIKEDEDVAQEEDPEFDHQYCKRREREREKERKDRQSGTIRYLED